LRKEDIRSRITDLIIFAAALVIFSYFFGRLVYCQTIYAGRTDGYRSDIVAYMAYIVEGKDSGYIISYPIFFWLGRLFSKFMSVDYAITWVEVLLNAAAVIITKYFFDKIVFEKYKATDKWYTRMFVSFVTIACFFLSMWWLPRLAPIHLPGKYQVFLGTYSGNPWHNSTYIATRPFAIAAFFSFVSLLDTYEDKFEVKDGVLFGISLLLSTMAKPSFTLLFVSTAGLVMAFRLIKSRFKNFKNTMLLTLCFLPTFADLYYQFFMVFGEGNPNEEHGIGFGWFDVWKVYNEHVLAAIFYANAFALFCILCFLKDVKEDAMYRFSIVLFLVSVLEAGILYEKGERFIDFNFGWGYMHGIFFFELVAAIKLTDRTIKKQKPVLTGLCWVLFLIHLVAGVMYFRGLYYGYDYNTLLPCTWTT
jgi:hypothetical protein